MGRKWAVGQLGRIALVVAACSGCASEAKPQRPSGQRAGAEAESAYDLLDLFNRGRRTAGRSLLKWSSGTQGLAYVYSDELRRASEVRVGHPYVASSERFTVLRLAMLAREPGDVYRALMNSPDAREIVLSKSAIDAGIAIIIGDEVDGRWQCYVTVMMYMPPGAEPPAAGSPAPATVTAAAALSDGPLPPLALPGSSQAEPRQAVSLILLEGRRIAGSPFIVPDDATRIAMMRSRRQKLLGSFKLCITADGQPAEVKPLQSMSYPTYDAKIVREMWSWRYRPYEVNGKRVPVCCAMTFIYSQSQR